VDEQRPSSAMFSSLFRARTTVLIASLRLLHPPGVPELDAIDQDRPLVTWR
jgi:hypothetical protein